LKTRDKTILELVYKLGYPVTKLASRDLTTVNAETLSDDVVEYLNSTNYKLLRFDGKGEITTRTIQSMIAKYPEHQTENAVFECVEEVEYHRIQGLTVDEEFELRLKEPDLDKFLYGCGYRTTNKTLSKLNTKGGGFDKNKQGYLYVLKFYNDNVEFVKFGITNLENEARHETQLYNARRRGINYSYDYIYKTPLLSGEFVADLEYKIDCATRNHATVSKEVMPDGYKESRDIDALPVLLEIINNEVEAYSN
jgi:hypothetical protein